MKMAPHSMTRDAGALSSAGNSTRKVEGVVMAFLALKVLVQNGSTFCVSSGENSARLVHTAAKGA